jgi:DNA-binding response OmpR family regulator
MTAPVTVGNESKPIALIGIGAESEFAIADPARMREAEALPHDRVILLDGDTFDLDIALPGQGEGALLDGEVLVLQTTGPSVRFVVSAFRRGIADLLAKPYHPEQLQNVLKGVLRGRV